MAAKVTQQNRLISAAIDFGTTFSSWAFSFRHTFEKDPTDVSSKNWNDGSHISTKAPTTVLIRPDGKTLEAFGYDAENRYINLVEDDEQDGFYLFTKFKMNLLQQKPFGDELMIEDETGKSLSALTVFSVAIGYLKDDLLETVNRQVTGGVTVDDVTWVLTVPAIWTDSAKWFMRRAAELVGICPENLRLSLEPEAASIFCRHIHVGNQAEGAVPTINISQLSPGTKYMVLDAGGGTVDITVHRVDKDGKIQEIHQASGGAWGGNKVNEAYQDFMRDLTGREEFLTFKNEHLEYFFDLERDFEIAKRKVDPDNDSKLRMKLPTIMRELIQEQAKNPDLMDKISLKMDKLFVHTETSRSLFKETITSITEHVATIFSDRRVHGTDIVLMVGGFSESKMLQKATRQALPDKSIIVPTEAGLAVLKGAVIFGHNDMDITSRISKYTYGLLVQPPFDPNIHPVSKLVILKNGQKMVNDVFYILIRRGDEVFPNKPCTEEGFSPQSGETGFHMILFTSPELNPKYVDDPGCIRIGEALIDCSDKQGTVGEAIVSLVLGGTEVEITAVVESTGEAIRSTFKF